MGHPKVGWVIAVAAEAALAASLLLVWYSLPGLHDERTGSDYLIFGIAPVVAGAFAVALIFRSHEIRGRLGAAALGVTASVLVVIRTVIPDTIDAPFPGLPANSLERQAGLLVALVAALALAGATVMVLASASTSARGQTGNDRLGPIDFERLHRGMFTSDASSRSEGRGGAVDKGDSGGNFVRGFNLLIAAFWTLLGAGGVIAAASGYETGGWVGLFAIAYGLYGFHRTFRP